jgi:predicted small secreted protein
MKNFMSLLIAAVLALSPLLQSCSTILYGSRQDLKINTVPEGAIARIGTQSCVTPCTLTVSRKERHIFITQDRSERSYRLTRSRHHVSFLLGNILWGIFPGMIIDSATGAKISLDDVFIITRTDGKRSSTNAQSSRQASQED